MSKPMTTEEWDRIMEETDDDANGQTDPIISGLLVMRKYIPDADICAAASDRVYACDIGDLLKAGITRDDIVTLAKLDWRRHETDALAHYVW